MGHVQLPLTSRTNPVPVWYAVTAHSGLIWKQFRYELKYGKTLMAHTAFGQLSAVCGCSHYILIMPNFENNPPMCQQQHIGFILPTHCQQCLHKRACYTRETLKVLAYLICCKLSGNIPRQHGVMYTENCPLVRVHQ